MISQSRKYPLERVGIWLEGLDAVHACYLASTRTLGVIRPLPRGSRPSSRIPLAASSFGTPLPLSPFQVLPSFSKDHQVHP